MGTIIGDRDQGTAIRAPRSRDHDWHGPRDIEGLQIHLAWRRYVAVNLDIRGYLASRRQRNSKLRTGRSPLEIFGQKCKDSQHPSTEIGRRQPYWLKYKIATRLKWSEGSRLKYPIFGSRRSRLIAATLGERQPRTRDWVRNFHPIDTNI
uniref:Uncharacterized protein n=1 Tax=Hyaloperonospora arabidopsidis (strain Emoy2) TaxID=559515 RepID=M4BP25_HYAAE